MKDEPATPGTPPPPDPLAVALSMLEPAPHGFDRDALLFAAGRESKMRLVSLWRTLAAAAAVVAVVFATLYFARPTKGQLFDRPAPAPRTGQR
jgi:predicted membrane-bound mannosyltransferase